MDSSNHFPKDILWQKDAFQFVDPDQFEALGIDPASVPLGTYISFRHPSQLRSRFGGNAYGFGFFEDYDRLNPDEIEKLNSIALDNPEDIRVHHKDLNEIHRKMGLLIRFSSLGHPYYLIPVHLISVSLAHIQAKVNEIVKIVDFHTKKYLKEYCNIGIMTHHDDLLLHELSFLFQDHHILIIDSPEKLLAKDLDLDIVILTHDLFETVTMGQFSRLEQQTISKKRLEQYSIYMLWKICNLLKSEGEIFIVADHFPAKTNHTTELTFKTEHEEKRFALFSHIFNTKKKYKIKDHGVRVSIFDLQKYLSGLYVEQEMLNTLLEGKALAELSMEEINKLPYLRYDLPNSPFLTNQEKTWSGLCSIFFDEIFLKPLVPDRVKEDWGKRFSCKGHHPGNMLTFLGQKKPLQTAVADIIRDVADSNLAGCAFELVADYKDSLEFVTRTLKVLHALKKGDEGSFPRVFIDRLRQPLENKNRRFGALNHVIKLTGKIQRLEKIRDYLNPDKIEGSNTPLLSNLEALTSFGFSHHELKEMILITLGHTTLGRIMSGKMPERSLNPVSEMARDYDPQQALNMLRYCRLMTMAETSATGGHALSNEQLARLFELYEATVRVVINQELDWEQLLDEETIIMGGIRNRIVKKILTMMGYFEFLENWSELRNKGTMEKEAMADYNDRKLSKIEEVIQLVNAIETFEKKYLKLDPLYLPAFYRKFLDLEFHGTSHLFERMGSLNVFVLLWITVNLARGESVNFNPILADVKSGAIDKRARKVQEEAANINLEHLDLKLLERFSEQLNQDRSSFIMGTGFQLKTSSRNKILEIAYKDLDKSLRKAETLSEKIAGCPISQISLDDLRKLEMVFTDLEMFYQSQLRVVRDPDTDFNIPARQRRWFEGTWKMRKTLWQNFVKVMFQPEYLHTDLRYLRRHAPVLLNFLLPEFTVLGNLDLSGNLYLNSPVTDYIIDATKKFQALVNHDRQNFQDLKLMHRLARREFGPMATGIMGVSQRQLEDLENIVERLKTKRDLFKSLTCSFIFQDVGRIPEQRAKYEKEINPADLAAAGAYILEKEKIGTRYGLNQKSTDYLIFLVRNHALLHHTIKGEVSFSAMAPILARGDKDLFDAFLITTFIMMSAIREDLMLEDLALWIFKTSAVCHGVIDGKTTLQKQLERVVMKRGKLFYATRKYQRKGLPKGVTPSEYLASKEWKSIDRDKRLQAGRMILATERIFRLRGIRYAEFRDLARLMMKVPLRYIHKKRKFHNVGFATFEKEVYEAFRIYKTLQSMQEDIRHFILEELVGDKVRIYGYEKVSGYLSYKNQIKLLLVGLAGTRKIRSNDDPISLNFMHMSETVEQRYEAINDFLDGIPSLELWGDDDSQLSHLFASETGILLRKEHYPNVLSVIFQNRVFITQKIDHMSSISDLEQLKIYFHYSLSSLRDYPFFTEDYEILLEKAFERRMMEITDTILDRTQRQMDLVKEFEDLYKLMNDLVERSRNIGFSPEQEHRLNDLYEMRKNILKREKLREIEAGLESIPDGQELRKYWKSIKWYLQGNRRFFGTEYELLIAQKFDAANARISAHQA
jgi:hypothetical protein